MTERESQNEMAEVGLEAGAEMAESAEQAESREKGELKVALESLGEEYDDLSGELDALAHLSETYDFGDSSAESKTVQKEWRAVSGQMANINRKVAQLFSNDVGRSIPASKAKELGVPDDVRKRFGWE